MSFEVHCMHSLLQQSFVMYRQRIIPKLSQNGVYCSRRGDRCSAVDIAVAAAAAKSELMAVKRRGRCACVMLVFVLVQNFHAEFRLRCAHVCLLCCVFAETVASCISDRARIDFLVLMIFHFIKILKVVETVSLLKYAARMCSSSALLLPAVATLQVGCTFFTL